MAAVTAALESPPLRTFVKTVLLPLLVFHLSTNLPTISASFSSNCATYNIVLSPYLPSYLFPCCIPFNVASIRVCHVTVSPFHLVGVAIQCFATFFPPNIRINEFSDFLRSSFNFSEILSVEL